MFRLPVSLGLTAFTALILAAPAAEATTVYIFVPRPIYDLYPLPKCVETHPESTVPPPLVVPEQLHNFGVCMAPV